MDKDISPGRLTFKRALQRISMISFFVTVTLISLLLCVASVLTLERYEQKNLELTAATMTYSLKVALVFPDNTAATEALAALGRQGQFSSAEIRNKNQTTLASWHNNAQKIDDRLNYCPMDAQTVRDNEDMSGEVRLTAQCSFISHFIWLSLAILIVSILLSSGISIMLTHHLHNRVVHALQNITDVLHDIRINLNISRRVSEELIEEFHRFAQDFYNLLDEMEEWQLHLQENNTQLLQIALHDPLTGLANRVAFRSRINALMNDNSARSSSALLFLDCEFVNDTWGHAAGDRVLIEVAKRLAKFGSKRHQPYRFGGDEFVMVLYGVHSEYEVQRFCETLAQELNRPFDLRNGHFASMTLSIGYALSWEHASAEKLQELADRNMYMAKHQHAERSIK